MEVDNRKQFPALRDGALVDGYSMSGVARHWYFYWWNTVLSNPSFRVEDKDGNPRTFGKFEYGVAVNPDHLGEVIAAFYRFTNLSDYWDFIKIHSEWVVEAHPRNMSVVGQSGVLVGVRRKKTRRGRRRLVKPFPSVYHLEEL